MKYAFLKFLVALCLFTYASSLSGQTDSTSAVSFSANADLVSRYVWRGMDIGHAPSIQPGLSVSWKDFTLGAWGAYKLTGEGDQETDFYLSKTFSFVTLAVWDYWCFNDTSTYDFFDFKKETTSHVLEAQVMLSGGKTLPFNFLSSYFFYGSDASKSIYFELQYERKSEVADLMIFAGYQAKGTYYASKANFVNIGCTVKKLIPVTDRLSLPVYLSFVLNPANRSPYLVAGITF